jgi:hypothetical protein
MAARSNSRRLRASIQQCLDARGRRRAGCYAGDLKAHASVVVAPQGQKTAATMNPALAYVGTYHQFAVEAIVPLNSEGRQGVGVARDRAIAGREQLRQGTTIVRIGDQRGRGHPSMMPALLAALAPAERGACGTSDAKSSRLIPEATTTCVFVGRIMALPMASIGDRGPRLDASLVSPHCVEMPWSAIPFKSTFPRLPRE